MASGVFGSLTADQAVSGLVAGSVSTLLVHPLDMIKTRLQGAPLSPIDIA